MTMQDSELTSGPPGAVRVVLVGRTGLESVLRRQHDVELARSRSPMDAIGEFAEISEIGDSRPAAVIVGVGELNGANPEQFVSALRKIEPDVRVLGVGGRIAGFDGTVDAAISAADLRLAMLDRAPSPPPAPVEPAPVTTAATNDLIAEPAPIEATTSPEPAVASAPPAPTVMPVAESEDPAQNVPRNDPANDLGPLTAIVSGRDAVATAVDEISARLGVACGFVPGEAQSLADAAASVRVNWRGKTLGWLRAPGVDRASVEREARWLAGWVVLARQQDQLRETAFIDELTGAYNRHYFMRQLHANLKQAQTLRHGLTLMILDIDDFKKYNDRYGHSAGDEILQETVRLLKSVIRPSDRVCRIGGDEFAVIFHDPKGPRKPGAGEMRPESIAQIAARFQKQICTHRFPKLLDEAPGTLTISAGMATYPWDGASPEDLMEKADQLALQSKRQGKNCITFGPGATRVCDVDPD